MTSIYAAIQSKSSFALEADVDTFREAYRQLLKENLLETNDVFGIFFGDRALLWLRQFLTWSFTLRNATVRLRAPTSISCSIRIGMAAHLAGTSLVNS